MNRRQILKRAMILAVPIMIQNGITNAVGLVDHIMVGSLGTEAMTAVSIVGQLLFVYTLAVFGGLSGPGIFTAQFYGRGDTEGIRSSARMKALIAITVTVAGIAVLLLGEDILLNLYMRGGDGGLDVDLTLHNAGDYLHIMLLGLPALAVTMVYSSTLRETGDTVKPMVAGIVSVSADVLFNYLLIYGSLGFPQMGVRGAAVATVIARYLEASVLVIWTYARRDRHPFIVGLWRTLRIPRALVRRMLVKTIPILCNEFLWAAGLAALTQTYSLRGLDVVAGVNISNVLCNLLNVVFVALGCSVGILVGQALGAGEFDRAKKESATLTWFTAVISAITGAVLIAFSGVFPLLYDTTEAVRAYATGFIIISAIFFPVQGVLNALYFTLRSGGKTLITFAFDSVFSWSVTLPLALILCKLTDLPIFAVYVAVQAADILKIIIGAVMIRKGVWINNLASEFE
jgi:putative MATE family efflux protein